MGKFKVGDLVVRCANGHRHASEAMPDGTVGEIKAISKDGDITFNHDTWWDSSYFRICEEAVVDKILTKYSGVDE